jgi:hypothetical protein
LRIAKIGISGLSPKKNENNEGYGTMIHNLTNAGLNKGISKGIL